MRDCSGSVEVRRAGGGRGMGLFAARAVPAGARLYDPAARVRIPRPALEAIVEASGPRAARALLSWGWAEGPVFVLPVSHEVYVNHAPGARANCREGVALRALAAGEEVLEDYSLFDAVEPWYGALAARYGAWVARA